MNVCKRWTQFQRKWGRRPLEDHWRRRKKELSTFNENLDEEMLAEGDSTQMVGPDGEPLPTDSIGGPLRLLRLSWTQR